MTAPKTAYLEDLLRHVGREQVTFEAGASDHMCMLCGRFVPSSVQFAHVVLTCLQPNMSSQRVPDASDDGLCALHTQYLGAGLHTLYTQHQMLAYMHRIS